ncbi:DNA-3-methyladenine glycosylase family protein [Ilumatobacter nonamiensis]|uniref:DNA-3-methyladenine glycosylase family protein n=1 Tax=Ilumatobacter nonamiensis TaxID=467093 RepID=UPI0011D1E42D|nr:DNA-3-methyladenine glycosylase 2 family protein [Ilumatobacter nonamiensis]
MTLLDRTAADEPVATPSTTRSRLEAADIGATLSWFRHGRNDPTTWIDRIGRGSSAAGRFVRATSTPDGPATLLIRWGQDTPLHAETWGPGADWLLAQVPAMVGDLDEGARELETDSHPVVARCVRANRTTRFGASANLYHELLPTIIEQRITSVEAKQQWATLCRELSEPAPGPFTGLRLPPAPEVLHRQPSWWFHPLGIERKRAQTLIEVSRHAGKLWTWAGWSPSDAAAKLRLIPGVGVWTLGCVLAPALGDPDAVPVGDYHVKNIVAWNLAGEARATDDRMLQLLGAYAGQRGRVVNAIMKHGDGAPKYGPKHRILPMRRW